MMYADDNPFTYLIKGLNPDTISEDYEVTLKVETMLHSASISGSVSFNHSPSCKVIDYYRPIYIMLLLLHGPCMLYCMELNCAQL